MVKFHSVLSMNESYTTNSIKTASSYLASLFVGDDNGKEKVSVLTVE